MSQFGNGEATTLQDPVRKPRRTSDTETPTVQVQKASSTDISLPISDTFPASLCEGSQFTKVSASGKTRVRFFRLDIDQKRIFWDSRSKSKTGIIDFEAMREIRFGPEAAAAFRFQDEYANPDRFLSIIYVEQGAFKQVNLVAPNTTVCSDWATSLQSILAEAEACRRYGSVSVGGYKHLEERHLLWLKQKWRSVFKGANPKLTCAEAHALCKRLNIYLKKDAFRQKFQVRYRALDSTLRCHRIDSNIYIYTSWLILTVKGVLILRDSPV